MEAAGLEPAQAFEHTLGTRPMRGVSHPITPRTRRPGYRAGLPLTYASLKIRGRCLPGTLRLAFNLRAKIKSLYLTAGKY